jgi:hypothetical protein
MPNPKGWSWTPKAGPGADHKNLDVMTVEGHRAVAAQLQRVRTLAMSALNTLSNSGSATALHVTRARKELHHVLREIDSARSELEEQLFKDHPQAASTNVYYGGEAQASAPSMAGEVEPPKAGADE